MSNAIEDIKTQWLNVVRCLQSYGRKQQGVAILSIKVVVNSDGVPIFWSEPEMTKLHPKSKAGELLMRMIGGT